MQKTEVPANASGLLVKTLELRNNLSAQDRQLLEDLPWRYSDVPAGADVAAQSDRPKQSCLIVSGLMGRAHLLESGARQISNIHFPGDFIDLHGFVLTQLDHNITAMTACRVATVDHKELLRITDASANLARQLWMLTAIDAAIERVWLACMGRRSAEAHMAHLLCESFMRMRVVGLVDGLNFELALTQAQLADVMGLSVVHVNRTLQRLRGDDLIEWTRQEVMIRDWEALSDFAEFDPGYLNLRKEFAAAPQS